VTLYVQNALFMRHGGVFVFDDATVSPFSELGVRIDL
jgi:hypothetical protein